jgi:uncharacterized protein YjdB
MSTLKLPLVTVLFFGLIISCGKPETDPGQGQGQGQTTPQVVAVSSVSLDKTSLTLTEGESATLAATVKPDNATNKTVSWSSSSSSVATVDASGKVTAVAEGSATITAKAGDKSATCSVTVKKNIVAVESVTLDITSLILNEGESITLIATVKPDNATDKTVTWTSDKASVATVDANGKVTAVGDGTATITAKAGDKSATCTVMVMKTDIPVEGITLDKYHLELTEGETATITATVTPDNATNKTVTWSSGNPLIASVDQNGKVTGLADGTATITAKAGGKTATCTVIVKNNVVPVESVTLSCTSLGLIKGEAFTLTATVKPDNATDKSLTWSSSNTTVATVDQAGWVSAIAEGSTTITVKAGDKSATCVVTVTEGYVPVESVSLNKTSLELAVGEDETLVATVWPANATNKTISWTSDNTWIASVDQNGKVTANWQGTATIKAYAGDKSAACTLTVKPAYVAVESVTLNKTSLELTEGEITTLTAIVEPWNATNKTVTWTSSNSSVVSVDQDGNISAKKAGTATVTATAENVSATCTVFVKAAVTGDPESFSNENGEW